MSLENVTVAETPASGSETTTAAPETSNAPANRYEGMIDLDNPEPEAANPVEEAETAETGEEPAESAEGAETEEPPESEPDPWDAYEDFEVEGKVVKIPAELKPYLMKDADYRKKTADVAERRREIDSREEQITTRQKLSENEIDAQVALSQVGAQLKQFETINWSDERAKCQDDPVALGELNAKWMEFHELRNLHQQGNEYLKETARQRTEMAQQETAKRLAATKTFAEKNIKGWTPALDNEITNWMVKERGYTLDTLKQAYNPQVYQIVHDAYQWSESLKRQQTAKPSTPAAKEPVAPTKTVSAKGNPAVVQDLSKVSMAEYVRLRSTGKS